MAVVTQVHRETTVETTVETKRKTSPVTLAPSQKLIMTKRETQEKPAWKHTEQKSVLTQVDVNCSKSSCLAPLLSSSQAKMFALASSVTLRLTAGSDLPSLGEKTNENRR